MNAPVGGTTRLVRNIVALAAVFAVASCGGGSGGSSPTGPGQGLVLVEFAQAAVDNVPLNRVLEFRFSEAVDDSTITSASIQLREGPDFGSSVAGAFSVRDGAEALVCGGTFLILDDVVTTGATLGSCARTLTASGAVRCIGSAVAFAR